MKIALVADGVYPYDHGGHQIRVFNFVRRYTRDHEVDLYVQQKPDVSYPSRHEGARVVEVDSKVESQRIRLTVGGVFYAREVGKELSGRSYDVVDVLFCCDSARFDAPTVVTYGAFLQRWREISGVRERLVNSVPTAIQYYLYRKTLADADHAVAISDQSRRELRSTFSPQFPTETIKNGIDSEHFSSSGPTADLPDVGDHVGVFVGRLHDEKGVFELLDSVARTDTDFGLVYVGTGPARDELTRRASELGIEDRVAFEGFVEYEQIPDYYRAADVCLLPSYFEIQPLVCLEAMACDTPVIASDIAGVREMVTDGDSGILVPPSSVGPLARAIDRLFTSGSLYDQLVERGREFADTRTWDRVTEATLSVYRDVVD